MEGEHDIVTIRPKSLLKVVRKKGKKCHKSLKFYTITPGAVFKTGFSLHRMGFNIYGNEIVNILFSIQN